MSGPSELASPRRSGWLLVLIRLILAWVFIYMGSNKLGDPIAFLKGIHLYDMLPEEPAVWLNSSAIVVPWLEVMSGAALLLGVAIRGAALVIAAMLAVFTPAVLLRALEIMRETGQSFFAVKFDCGCGTGEAIIWQKTIENAALFALALAALLLRSRRCCLENLWRNDDLTAPTSVSSSPHRTD
ncbi:MAG: DoxX family protein [Planctomycetota bacterium]